jgi:hypothetical protein
MSKATKGKAVSSTVNNLVDWPHSGTVLHYSGYMEPRDGAKKQLCVCSVFRKKDTVVKGSYL